LRAREWSKLKKIILNADIVIEVLDARDPYITRCKQLENLVTQLGKKLVLVINKADLVPKEVLDSWKRVLNKEYPTVYISAQKRLGTRHLWRLIKLLATKFPVKVAVVGYPNVGKSTIINVLKGKYSSGTSPLPGFTKTNLKLRVASWLIIFDTPGIIPKGEDEEELVIKGALRPEALEDPINPAIKLIMIALARDPKIIETTYGLRGEDPYELLIKLAKKRGLLLKNEKPNVDEAARIILRDWQRGKLVFYSKPEHYGLK